MSVKEDCEIVGVCYENIENITIKEVIQAYRKRVLKVHPDKVDEKNKERATEECKVLNKAYERLLKYLVEKAKENREKAENEDQEEESDEEKFTEGNFKNFNFPTENDGSFTVKIQHSQADEWQENLVKIYGEPKVHKSSKGTVGDTFWQFNYSVEGRETLITLHIYNKPKNKKPSKLLIQSGDQSLVCIYVFYELPRIYKNIHTINAVTEEKQRMTDLVKCGQCKVKATLTGMKMHLKKAHSNSKSKKSQQSLASLTTENGVLEFRCGKCEYIANSRANLVQHTDAVHEFPWKLRSKNGDETGNLSQHMNSVHAIQDRVESPDVIDIDIECMDESEEEDVGIVEERDCHTPVPESLFICGECTNGFENETDVEIHMKMHHAVLTQDERIKYLEAQLIAEQARFAHELR